MRQTRSSGLIRHNFDFQSKYLRQTIGNYERTDKNPSPISILDQENMKPAVSTFAETTKRIKESFILKENQNPIPEPALRKSYETGVKFFGIDYERIQQLRGKYLNRYGIRNQALSMKPSTADNMENTMPIQSKTITATFGRGDDILKDMKSQIRASMDMLKTGKIMHHHLQGYQKQPRVQFQQNFDIAQRPIEFQNEELNNYLRKYREKDRSTSLNSHVTKQSEETLTKVSEINQDIESKMKRLYEKLEEKEARKRARKEMATQYFQASPQQQTSPPLELPPKINDTAIVLAIEQQIRFDMEFRRLRESIPKNQMDRIIQIMTEKCPSLTKQRLQITKNQVNPFEQKKDNATTTIQQLSQKLIDGYERAQRYFQTQILNQFQIETVKAWLEEVDIDRSENVNIGNIITHLNLKIRGEYRNRDIVRLAARLGGGKEIPKTNLLNMLAKN